MQDSKMITIFSDKQEINLNANAILYVQMKGNNAFVHVTRDVVYRTRMTLSELEGQLGDDFIKIKRGCLVSIRAIHDITEQVNLCNGENLDYVVRRRKEMREEFHEKQARMIQRFAEHNGVAGSNEMFREHYRVFDTMPFAFADIEMVFDGENRAVDWIFRYGNEALAELEKLPLEKLVGSSFAAIFPNMDMKWLQSYERATLYGETLRIIDYSPEIDAYLDVICFPTFEGHCGCILFDISKIKSFRKATDAERALSVLFERLLKGM